MYTHDGQEEPGLEQPAEDLVSNLRCMKYSTTMTNLITIMIEQHGMNERPEVDVVGRHLERGEDGQDQRDDLDVDAVAGVLVLAVGRRCRAPRRVTRSRSDRRCVVDWLRSLMALTSGRDQVDEGEDDDPHDVDEVPVQADQLDDLGLVAGDLAPQR